MHFKFNLMHMVKLKMYNQLINRIDFNHWLIIYERKWLIVEGQKVNRKENKQERK